jgi:hypothetical protein
LVLINQKEAEYLREHERGFDIHISSVTHKGRAKRYYLTTNKKSVDLLNQYRKKVGNNNLITPRKNEQEY